MRQPTRHAWPKTRPALPDEYVESYTAEYEANREGRNLVSSMAQKLESWMHRRIAARARPGQRILEFGAGTLNHIQYEHPSGPARYDIVEPFKALFADSPRRALVNEAYDSLDQVTEKDYDRIISIAVLEHMDNLPLEITLAKRLLAPGGLFQAGIPCEGGLLWGMAWRMSTGLAFKARTGLDYGVVMRHEHLNDYDEILTVLRAAFDQVSVRLFPLPLKHLAFYAYLECRDIPVSPASRQRGV